MDTPPDYFRLGYRDDTAELRRALEPIAKVLEVFEDHFDSAIGGWPYSVGGSTVSSKPPFSNSTNAMIVFALLATTGALRRSVLLPLTRPVQVPASLDEKRRVSLRKLVVATLDTLAQRMDQSPEKVQLVSRTFGVNDPFTVTWLVEAHAAVAKASDGGEFGKRTEQLKGLAKDVFSRVKGTGGDMRVLAFREVDTAANEGAAPFEVPHPFPLLRVAQLSEAVRQIAGEPSANLAWIRERFVERLRRNLADHLITDSPSDAADLVFSLEGMLASEQPPDESMTEAVFAAIRESQTRNAYWRPVRPFIATRQGHALLPLSIEVANSLLRSCDRLERTFPERSFFSENVPLFKRYAQWLRSRLVEIKVDGKGYRGWHSEHTLPENTIDLWETSQVLVFLLLYADRLKRHIARATLMAARLSVTLPSQRSLSPAKYWEEKAIPKEPLIGFAAERQVSQLIAESFVRSRDPETSARASYSMLLYGPPGTGKTGIAEDLAAALQQPLITITPSDFLAEGPNEVEARAKVIFDALGAQADCVIVFDEIDRLLLDRDSLMYHKQSDAFQFMTPSMLVKLKDLRKAKQTVFVIATNYYERIDPAARRTGRIDHRYLVLPPCREQRRRIIVDLVKAESARVGNLPEPEGAQFDEALNRTALYAFSELELLVHDAFATARPRSGSESAEFVFNATKENEPTIRIAAYRSRFHATRESNSEMLSEQQPVQEFVALLELLEESGRLAEAQADANKILKSVRSGIQDAGLKSRVEHLLKALEGSSRA